MNLQCVLILLAAHVNHIFGARILGVFMTPSYSHQIVYQPIWRELSLRGHQVTVLTPNPLRDPKLTNLTEIDLSSVSTAFKEENEADLLSEKSVFGEVKRFAKIYEQLTHDQLNYSKVQALIENKNESFDLLLVEYLYPSMYALKDVFNCPIVGITSLGLTALGNELIGNPKNPAFDPDISMEVSFIGSFQERLKSTFLDLFSRWSSKYLLMRKLDKLLPKYIHHEIRPLYDICRDFSLVIVNSNLAVKNARPLVPNLIDVSGIHIQKPKPLPQDLTYFLNQSTEGVIYFSLGSNMKSSLFPQKIINGILQVFSELPYKVLWKFEMENLPNKPENVEIRRWLPQQDLLAHPNVKLFISQGGIQSIDETLSRRVPMLIIPFFADQFYNAHNMVRKGAALSLNYHNISMVDFKNAILELMDNPKYQSNVDKLSLIASDQIVPALEKAVWWIEYVLRHDGAKHLMYYGRDVPFYQFYLLDIIGALLCSFAVSVYVSRIVTKSILRFLLITRQLLKNNRKPKSE